MDLLNRRSLVMGAASAALALTPLCALAQTVDWSQQAEVDDDQVYGPIRSEPFPINGVNVSRLDPRFLRTVVDYDSREPAGTIIIDPAHRFLYLTDGHGQALRYGVGVGRQGFLWSGVAMIHDKREWPDWYPPKEMLARDPAIMASMSKLQGGIGMPGGVGNPLGARAMYLFQSNKDTLYRIHGTLEPYTIGTNVSSGCIRMINQDVMDLYNRVPVGTKVVVLGDARPAPQTARREAVPQPDAGYDQDPMPTDPRSGPIDPDQSDQ